MTVKELFLLADPSGQAKPDIDLRSLLANKIAPEFLHDIRGVSWRRKVYTFSTEIGLQHYAMPPSFATCMSVRISGVERKLDHIGEDEQKIEAALDTTTQARPYQYWFERPSNEDIQTDQLWFNCPPDQVYSVHVWHRWMLPPALPDDFGLDPYIPVWLQAGLAVGLEREIKKIRVGIGDPMFRYVDNEFTSWKARAGTQRELGPEGCRNVSVF